MTNKPKSSSVGDFDFDSSGMLPRPKFITITVNNDRPEVHLRGEFDSPSDNTTELAVLYKMSEEYEDIHVYINSVGGQVDLLTELLNVFKKFKTVVTIGTGCIASSGFILWSAGDIRVIQPYTYIMSHRESYGIGNTKTVHHKRLAEYSEELFGKMMNDVCSDVMTLEEIEEAKHSEVYYTAETLINRGVAISWDIFLGREQIKDAIQPLSLITINERLFLEDDGMFAPVEEMTLGTPIPYNELIYDFVKFPYEYFEKEVIINQLTHEVALDDSGEIESPKTDQD